MSRENLEIVQRGIEAFNAQGVEGIIPLKTTGLDLGQDAVMVWTLRDGKATRIELFPTLDEALEAAKD